MFRRTAAIGDSNSVILGRTSLLTFGTIAHFINYINEVIFLYILTNIYAQIFKTQIRGSERQASKLDQAGVAATHLETLRPIQTAFQAHVQLMPLFSLFSLLFPSFLAHPRQRSTTPDKQQTQNPR
jgi:hypothetical protein